MPFSDGMPKRTDENLLTGFWSRGTDRAEVRGRPADVRVAPDGAFQVIDDTGGTIWRITHGDAETAVAQEGDGGLWDRVERKAAGFVDFDRDETERRSS